MSTPTDLATAAHDYARRGWRVIPLHRVGPDGLTCSCNKGRRCTSKGKHPKDNEWQKAERLTGPEIEDTWRIDLAPNLGIATGETSGFFVLDIDPKGGGFESMRKLNAEHGKLPDTLVFQTGSGGYHYLFTMPDVPLRNSQGRVADGIDIRANGGQIVAPPSRSGKGVYTVTWEAPLAPAPQWLIDAAYKEEVDVEAVTAEELPKPEDLDEQTWKRLSAYAQRAIDSELKRLDECGNASTPRMEDYRGPAWNHTTFEVACSLIEFANSPWCAYSLGQAKADLLERAPRDHEFDGHVIVKTFQSARERIGDKARPMPEDRRREPDPLFGDPDPTEGGGAQADPAVEGGRKYPWRELFGGEKGTTPLYAEMARGVFDRGPVGWGRDNDFWSYDGGVWKPDHYVVQHRLVDMLGNAYKTGHRSNTADIVQRHAQPITGDPLEPLMNFRNGMLDWRTGDLTEHEATYGSTVQLGCAWDPEATCPRFEAFLDDIMHPDYVALAWEMIGYLMMSGNPQQVAFLFYGSGGNGKGTLLDTISRLLGNDNIATESLDDLNGNRFRSANLFGKIANIAGDIDATYQEHTAMFKSITGEDWISAEHKNMASFRFQSWAVPVFSANKFPGSADVTEGYLRRWIVLNFHKRIAPKNIILRSELMAQFEAEMPGIAARGVRALRTLIERGHFAPDGEATKAKDEFALHIDQVRQWLADDVVTSAPEVETPLAALYEAYQFWSGRKGHRRPLGETEFSARLEGIGYPAERIVDRVYHRNISVPPTSERARDRAAFGF